MSENWRQRNAERAINSEKQCGKCGHMSSGNCTKWKYSKECTIGEWNMAPWCQFFTLDLEIDKKICPHCQRPF